MTLQELLSEKGMYLVPRATITIEDIKHLSDHDGTHSHGDYIRALQDFYEEKHQELIDAQLDILQDYLENK